MLLYASTHRPHIAEIEGVRVVNPGSALLPADGSKPSIAILKIEDGKLTARIVEIAR
jgi:predicted phosphodiesterase